MTKFICLTCYKTEDDSEIKYWDDKPCCTRCLNKYNRFHKNDTGIPKNRG